MKHAKKEGTKNQLTTSIITIIILIVVIVILFYLAWQEQASAPKTFEEIAQQFCETENIEGVSICNNQVIEILPEETSAQYEYYHRDRTEFTCPVTPTTTMSPQCRAIANARNQGQWICQKIC